MSFFHQLVGHLLFSIQIGMPCVRQDLKVILRGLQMDLSHNLSMRILIISSQWALFESSLLMMFLISSTEKPTSESNFSAVKEKSDGNVLRLPTFYLKSVMNLVSWESGGTQLIFLPFKRVFNKVLQDLTVVSATFALVCF